MAAATAMVTPPPLPIPPLDATLLRLLASAEPLATAAEFKRLAQRVFRFAAGDGAALDKLLREHAAAAAREGKSWLIDWWNRVMYTAFRDPLPINVSYWYLLSARFFAAAERTPPPDLQLSRAAWLVLASAHFRDLALAGSLPPEGGGIDPRMHRYIWHACRLPRPEDDGVRVYDGSGACAPSDTVIVLHRGQLVVVSLMAHAAATAATYRRVTHDELVARLREAVRTAREAPHPPSGLPLCTAAHRETWAGVFARVTGGAGAARPSHGVNIPADASKELPPRFTGTDLAAEAAAANLRAITAIEASLCVVCLDEALPPAKEVIDPTIARIAAASRNLLDGSGGNRWFDKAAQWVVTASGGQAGFIGEHSHSDGAPTAQLMVWMAAAMKQAPFIAALQRGGGDAGGPVGTPSAAVAAALVQGAAADNRVQPAAPSGIALLRFTVPGTAAAGMADATRQYHELVESHDLVPVIWSAYGREWVKRQGFSPDAWAEMALQLAHFRWKGTFVGTYEPAHTRRFLWGRTACIRVVSAASCRWVTAMTAAKAAGFNDEGVAIVDAAPAEKVTLLREACNTHVETAKRAGAGHDIDRHMLGMKLLGKERGIGFPRHDGGGSSASPAGAAAAAELYSDPVYTRASTWHISTSNLSVEEFDNWGWGEVTPGGLGVAFSTLRDSLRFNIVGERSTGIRDFAAHLATALRDMQDVLAAAGATVADGAAPGRVPARL